MDLETAGKDLMKSMMRFNKLHLKHKPDADLKPSEIFTLATIYNLSVSTKSEGVKVTDISTELEVSPPTVSQNIAILEKKGYVQRKHSTNDRRTVLVSVTEKGHTYIHKKQCELFKKCTMLTRHLGIKDSLKLSELLTKAHTFFKENSN